MKKAPSRSPEAQTGNLVRQIHSIKKTATDAG